MLDPKEPIGVAYDPVNATQHSHRGRAAQLNKLGTVLGYRYSCMSGSASPKSTNLRDFSSLVEGLDLRFVADAVQYLRCDAVCF